MRYYPAPLQLAATFYRLKVRTCKAATCLTSDHQAATAFLYQGGEIFRRAARLFVYQNNQPPVVIKIAFAAVPFVNLSVSPNSYSGERSGFKKVVCRHERSSAIAAQIDDQSRSVNQSSQFLGE